MAPALELRPDLELTVQPYESAADVIKLPYPPSAFVIEPSLITSEHDALKFEAAASLQVLSNNNISWLKSTVNLSTQLISSPYNDPSHYLDLSDLDPSTRLFAKSLTLLRPVRADYATAGYVDAFNWESLLEFLRSRLGEEGLSKWQEQSFYVVIFRSKLNEVIDRNLIKQLDYESHREACESGGLLKYWFGTPNDERRNLATCLWRSKEDARKGGLGPWHKKARNAAREIYASIVFTTHRLTVLDGAKDWKFEDWVGE